jgi:hypothetical protein
MTIHNISDESSAFGVPFVFCLDGRVPEADPILGPAFAACIYCTPVCPDCFNVAIFPAEVSMRAAEEGLIAIGLRGVYCACGGFLGVFAGDPR